MWGEMIRMEITPVLLIVGQRPAPRTCRDAVKLFEDTVPVALASGTSRKVLGVYTAAVSSSAAVSETPFQRIQRSA